MKSSTLAKRFYYAKGAAGGVVYVGGGSQAGTSDIYAWELSVIRRGAMDMAMSSWKSSLAAYGSLMREI